MKYCIQLTIIGVLMLFVLTDLVEAAEKVVIIPLGVKKGYPAPVSRTGQDRCTYHDGTNWQLDDNCTNNRRPPGQDGDLQPGITFPNPRFTNNSDGTVTDNLTGLTWLQDARCAVFFLGDTTGRNWRDWSSSLSAANQLAHGFCNLNDHSSAGDWRVPSRAELLSIVDLAYLSPALSNAAGTAQWSEGDPFFRVEGQSYWSSSWFLLGEGVAVSLGSGSTEYYTLETTLNVWPVRGGQ